MIRISAMASNQKWIQSPLYDSLFFTAAPEKHQVLRFFEGQWFQEHAIYDAENGSVRPDPERNREHGDCRKGRTL